MDTTRRLENNVLHEPDVVHQSVSEQAITEMYLLKVAVNVT